MFKNDKQNEKELYYKRVYCRSQCHKYNSISPEMVGIRQELIKKIIGKTKTIYMIEQPFICDYGFNIEIGENFYSNSNLLVLDVGKVIFGNDVLVGPNCSIYTTFHPLNFEQRKNGKLSSKPVLIGNNVWIGGNVTILPGVTIGDNSVIGAGSVVVKDIPKNTVSVGNPCKVLKYID